MFSLCLFALNVANLNFFRLFRAKIIVGRLPKRKFGIFNLDNRTMLSFHLFSQNNYCLQTNETDAFFFCFGRISFVIIFQGYAFSAESSVIFFLYGGLFLQVIIKSSKFIKLSPCADCVAPLLRWQCYYGHSGRTELIL